MKVDEKKVALEVYRLRNWVENANNAWNEFKVLDAKVRELGAHAQMLTNHVSMAMLEVEDQRQRLLDLGVTVKELDALAPMPNIDLDPLSVVRQLEKVREGLKGRVGQ